MPSQAIFSGCDDWKNQTNGHLGSHFLDCDNIHQTMGPDGGLRGWFVDENNCPGGQAELGGMCTPLYTNQVPFTKTTACTSHGADETDIEYLANPKLALDCTAGHVMSAFNLVFGDGKQSLGVPSCEDTSLDGVAFKYTCKSVYALSADTEERSSGCTHMIGMDIRSLKQGPGEWGSGATCPYQQAVRSWRLTKEGCSVAGTMQFKFKCIEVRMPGFAYDGRWGPNEGPQNMYSVGNDESNSEASWSANSNSNSESNAD